MEDKQALIARITPQAILKAMTPESKNSIIKSCIGNDIIGIWEFPFRIGRESRVQYIDGKMVHSERVKITSGKQNNDIYLIDQGEYLQISRQHIRIEKTESGYTLIDRGSACGTIVNTLKIGSEDIGGSCELKDEDIIKLGSEHSPYEFKFITLS